MASRWFAGLFCGCFLFSGAAFPNAETCLREVRNALPYLRIAESFDERGAWEELQTLSLQDRSHPSMERRYRLVRNDLAEFYDFIVTRVAAQIAKRIPPWAAKIDEGELRAEGFFGLLEAIDGFEPHRGIHFEAYATPRVRGAILDWLREQDPLPRQVRTSKTKVDAVVNALQQRGDHPGIDDEEFSALLDLPIPQVKFIRRRAKEAASFHSIDAEVGTDSGEGRETQAISFRKTLSAPTNDPSDRLARRDAFHALTRGMDQTKRSILWLYYFEDLKMKDVGQTIGLSEGRVSQLHDEAIKTLKAKGPRSAELLYEMMGLSLEEARYFLSRE